MWGQQIRADSPQSSGVLLSRKLVGWGVTPAIRQNKHGHPASPGARTPRGPHLKEQLPLPQGAQDWERRARSQAPLHHFLAVRWASRRQRPEVRYLCSRVAWAAGEGSVSSCLLPKPQFLMGKAEVMVPPGPPQGI